MIKEPTPISKITLAPNYFLYFQVIIALTITLAPVLAQTRASENSPFKVGVIQSLTGIAAEDGLNTIRALQLAAKELNAKNSTKIELIIEDDQSQGKEAASAFNRLAASKVEAVIGATWSFTTNAIIPLAKMHSLVTINTSSVPEALPLKQGGGYAFCNGISVATEDAPFREFLKIKKPTTIALISTGTSWGEIHRQACRKIATEEGITIVDDFQSEQILEGDWLNAVTKIRSKKPEAVVLLLNKEDINNFLRRAKEQRFSPQVFASKNILDAFRLAENKSIYEGICFTYNQDLLKPENSFTEKFKSQFSETPRIYADNSYDALFLLHQAFKTARETNKPLRDALEQSTYQGVAGEYRYFLNTSFATGQMSLLCVKNGSIETGN